MTGSTGTRARRAALAVLVLLAVAVGGYLIGSHVRSSRQAAADAGPQPRTRLTVPVRRQVLSATVVFRATYSVGAAVAITAVPALPGSDPVVTKVFIHPGENVKAGQPLIELAGLPIIALSGDIPAYRDLGNGDSGPDVVELQHALRAIGYGASSNGTLDSATAEAYLQLLSDDGYPTPVGASPDGKRITITKSTLVFLSRLPATVASVAAKVGTALQANDAWASLRTGAPILTAAVPTESASSVKPGTRVRLFDDINATSATARVTTVGRPSTGTTVRALLAPIGAVPFADGADLRAVATIDTTGAAALSVPVIAVHTDSTGTPYLTLVHGSQLTDVPVQTGLVANGYVQITGTSGTTHLAADDQVLVSR